MDNLPRQMGSTAKKMESLSGGMEYLAGRMEHSAARRGAGHVPGECREQLLDRAEEAIRKGVEVEILRFAA
jgi:hypothetical protein